MSQSEKIPASTEKEYHISKDQLPLSCPTDEMILWNAHPKVYLPIEKSGVEICPYCGAKYVLKDE
jgi:uncharacterized Zn-finger protein